ncbi:hypothetical protein [Flavobacterium selenitireducens]|uniref:hypothetical protein n=1 Tax=Flavobacterium selenitireducens TaxID=2722704 RepID=UPI00168A41B4|nr:hypothetical protein [Flavobacterium selenitireducens]MBD3583215.1 hypothetical protein [Flavobacterium selenitireducens]
MKNTVLTALMLGALPLFAQDTIVKRNNEIILGKVIEVRASDVLYNKHDNAGGAKFAIDKKQLSEINYANGTSEDYSGFEGETGALKKRSESDTRDYIVRMINEFGFQRGSDKRRLKASFEGDVMRIVVMNKKGKPVDEGELYDISTAFKFQAIDRRENNIGILNIWVNEVDDVRKTDPRKVKLLIEMRDQDAAHELRQAFVHLRQLQKESKVKIEKF